MDRQIVIRIENLHVEYLRRGRKKSAVRGVDMTVFDGESVGIIGESGCGKSSLAKALVGIVPFHAANATILGKEISSLSTAGWNDHRRQVQMVFQDVGGSLPPRMRVGDAVAEPLYIHKLVSRSTPAESALRRLFDDVGLDFSLAKRYPHELSGGQRQRIVLARALAVRPKILIADEPVASLDISIQTQVLERLSRLRAEKGLTTLFISHDLRTVKALTERVFVMYAGVIVECGPTQIILFRPSHPYTRRLLNSLPSLDQNRRKIIVSDVESGGPHAADACAFWDFCTERNEECAAGPPPFKERRTGCFSRCFRDGDQ